MDAEIKAKAKEFLDFMDNLDPNLSSRNDCSQSFRTIAMKFLDMAAFIDCISDEQFKELNEGGFR